MKKIMLFLGIMLFHGYICLAQTNGSRNGDKVEKVKIAFFTRQLNLTATESQEFWPVYNSYFLKLKKAWHSNVGNRPAFEEQASALKDRYRNDFVKILHSHERAEDVFKAEKSYRKMLKEELKNRKQTSK
ncbi:MAG TPA: hypothetical protein VL053_16025 [Arachidicoccus sp.]|nr:hypothetical protein [Arachidicoccus sp.]